MRLKPLSAVPFVVLLLSGPLGCSRHATEPVAGGSTPSAALVASEPPARSSVVPYDTPIWGEFDRPLAPASVSVRSVFLKLDGQRIPVTVSYDSLPRRVTLRPTVTLELRRTYTVEFTPAVRGTDGTPLPPGVFFQFTTNSLRRVVYDYPPQGSLEGPLVTLGWGGTQLPVNELFYEIYASEDSAAVAQRAVAAFQRSVFTRYVPHVAWRPGSRVYWAVTSENLLTGERMPGEVRSFEVLPATLPVEQVTIYARDHGSVQLRFPTTQYCTRGTLPCGPSYNGALHWSYGSIPANARVVGATMTIVALDAFAGATGGPATGVWMTQNDWSSCSIVAPGPPYPELSGLLANGFARTPVELEFSSDRLGAFLEAQARQRTLVPGVVVRAPQDVIFHSTSVPDPLLVPRVVVRFQRVPPGPAS
jgi:hypothetical protein